MGGTTAVLSPITPRRSIDDDRAAAVFAGVKRPARSGGRIGRLSERALDPRSAPHCFVGVAGQELFDFGQGGYGGRSDATQAEGGDGVGKAAGSDRCSGSVGRADEEGGGKDIAGAGQIDCLDREFGQLGSFTTVNDARALIAEGNDAEPASADALDHIARQVDLFVADDDGVQPPQQLGREA
jgi:hypothetical protein